MKLVKHIHKGYIKLEEAKKETPQPYLIWDRAASKKEENIFKHQVFAPKMALPHHAGKFSLLFRRGVGSRRVHGFSFFYTFFLSFLFLSSFFFFFFSCLFLSQQISLFLSYFASESPFLLLFTVLTR
jgi:hypothetical protein